MYKFSSSIIIFFQVLTIALGQNCESLFTYTTNFEEVSFYNQSSISNAHYFWNFGDGTSSFFVCSGREKLDKLKQDNKFLIFQNETRTKKIHKQLQDRSCLRSL
ncbi:MAG: hypothetical protein K1X82_11775, partial [Bacteroidia bacterium]|nr:hypothetical protein [Bacteroidia bacterium]